MAKRKDECLFCSSRTCSIRIYDELACNKYILDLEKHSDKVLGSHNGIMRNHVSGSGKYKRGEIYSWEVVE